MRMVAVTRPPMITTANGRAVSAPDVVDSAAGKRPSAAIIAVIATGRMRDSAPALHRLGRAAARIATQLADALDQEHAVLHRDAEERDESDQRRHRQRQSRDRQREHAADRRRRAR